MSFALPDGGGRIAVVSPHLDDAILSLGASIADASAAGQELTVVTVFAGDPDSTAPAGRWDSRAGFRTAGEAATRRREEDRRACALVGARPLWLRHLDGDYAPQPACADVAADLDDALADFEVVLLPGRPLLHPDHRWLVNCVRERGVTPGRVGYYAELPYDLWRESKADELAATWMPARASLSARMTKWRACGAYTSQLRWLGRGHRYRLALMRSRVGAEQTAWPE